MQNRKPLLLASVILVAAIAVIGLIWGGRNAGPESSIPSEAAGSQDATGILTNAGIPAVASLDAPKPAIAVGSADPIAMTVHLSPTCGCCSGWVEHLAAHGFEVTLDYREDMAAMKEEFGIRREHTSCHTAEVNGYIVEGHVPGEVIRRFLAEAPAVRGLTVPGMPVGSPGMESGDIVEPYDVLTFTSEGRTQV